MKKKKWLQRAAAILLTAAMCFGLTPTDGLSGLFEVQAANEGYTVTVSPSTTDVKAGDTVTLTITATSDGEAITDISGAGLNLTTWLDNYESNGHEDGNGDATISSPNALETDVTLPSEGTYYLVTELYDGSWTKLAAYTTTFTVAASDDSGDDEGNDNGDDQEEGYKVSVTPSTTDVKAGDTVTLTITATSNGETITDISSAGLNLTTWLDNYAANGHGDGNGDATIGSPNALETTVTLPSEGTYYLVTELYDGSWTKLASYTTTFTVAASDNSGGDDEVDNSDAVEADINVTKVNNLSEDFIMGMDISSIISEFNSGVTYKDFEGNTIDNITDFCKFLKGCGVTHIRVRIWNDPYDDNGNGYGGGNNDINTAVKIAEGCAAAGLSMLLDFHCSDFWTDPSKQQAPKEWANYDLEGKKTALKSFLTESLGKIQATGADIAMVQVGNETTAGFIGETGAANMCALFSAGAEAIRAFDPNIKIVIHVTNPEKSYMTTWAKNLDTYSVDYDILATSYYPSWHGTFANLASQLQTVQENYNKDVMVAETSYAFTLDETDGHGNTVAANNNDTMMCETTYPFTVQGQATYVRDLIKVVSDAGGLGVFWWESAWITVGDTTGLSGAEYDAQKEENKELWEANGSGWASSYSSAYDPDDAGVWYGGSAVDNQAMFAADGSALASINVWKYVRTGAISVSTSVDAISSATETIVEGGTYTLPDTITVTYNSGEKEEAVVWDAEDVSEINVNAPGTYVVNGTVTFSEVVDSGTYAGKTTASTTYTLTVEYANLIGADWSFENGSGNFSGLDSTGKGIDGETPYDGSYCLHWYLSSEGTGEVTYLGEDGAGITLEPGKYTFELKAQGYPGDTVSLSILDHNSGSVIAAGDEESLTDWANWHTPSVSFTIKETAVVDLKMTIGIQAGGWGTIDCMYLYDSGIRVTTLVQEGAPQVEFNISDEELVSTGIVESAELADSEIVVSLQVGTVDETVVAAEIQKIAEKAKNEGYTVGMYLDLTLWKTVNDQSTRLTDLNSAITICITIPESLRAEGRSYAIARFHDDEVTLIDGVYDAATGKFTFKTDRFSTYAIVYTDGAAVVTPPTTPQTPEKTPSPTTPSASTTPSTSTAPSASTAEAASQSAAVTSVETGDISVLPFIVAMAAAMGLMGSAVFMRRRKIRVK